MTRQLRGSWVVMVMVGDRKDALLMKLFPSCCAAAAVLLLLTV